MKFDTIEKYEYYIAGLQDLIRRTIVAQGTSTFGKGCYQQEIDNALYEIDRLTREPRLLENGSNHYSNSKRKIRSLSSLDKRLLLVAR